MGFGQHRRDPTSRPAERSGRVPLLVRRLEGDGVAGGFYGVFASAIRCDVMADEFASDDRRHDGEASAACSFGDDGNIAARLTQAAEEHGGRIAVEVPPRRAGGQRERLTFAELDQEVEQLARGLIELGAGPGQRIALAVKPGRWFLTVAFAVFRSRATAVLIDPGMGRKNVLECLREAEIDGLVGIPAAHLLRRLKPTLFRKCRIAVNAGRPLPGLGRSLESVMKRGRASAQAIGATQPGDSAAIIFTSGSTGTPKGVCYEHGMFDAQWQMIRDEYRILPGTRDCACFPLFGLFNVAMGVTTVWPPIDYAHPARATIDELWPVLSDCDQAFASPAIWRTVADHLESSRARLPKLHRALSAGAPLPPRTLRLVRQAMPPSDSRNDREVPQPHFHTPYGATEALPACTTTADAVLCETAEATARGEGTCVGRPFAGVDVRVIRRPTRPVAALVETADAAAGEIGEILVRSPAVTREYFNNPTATAAAKISDGNTFWHRIGDVGRFDDEGRLWFCGRVAHIVEAAEGPLYPVCLEPLYNEAPRVARTALVGIGERGRQQPVLCIEVERSALSTIADPKAFVREVLRFGQSHDTSHATGEIRSGILWRGSLPVDARHNAKIRREQIAAELDRSRIVALPDESPGRPASTAPPAVSET